MIRNLLVFVLIVNTQLFAQEYDTVAWKYAQTIKAKEISDHLHIFASDDFEGRETGEKGQKMAMEYLIENFKSYGIEDVNELNYVQQFPLIKQESKGVSLIVDDKNYQFNQDFTISPSLLNKKQINSELVFVGYGIEESNYNSYEALNVTGKIVFIWDGIPKNNKIDSGKWSMEKKIELAKSKNVAAVMVYNKNLEQMLEQYDHYFKKPKVALYTKKTEEIPTIKLTSSATEKILKSGKLKFKKIEKKGLKKEKSFALAAQLNIDKPTKKLSGENVLAYIPGTDKKEELVVITAHYDHLGKEGEIVYNGADDDGSGTVSLLEIAQAFQLAVKDGFQPKRSILIMPVSGEEKGLLGSKYYSQNPVFPLENTVANLNVDMIGRYDEAHENDSNYIYLIGSNRLSTDLHNLSEKVNEMYMNINLDYTFNAEDDPNRFYYRSDHYNFAKNGVPVIFYFSGVHEDYHKATDTVDKIDFDKTARVTQLIFLTAWHIANREERLQVDEKE